MKIFPFSFFRTSMSQNDRDYTFIYLFYFFEKFGPREFSKYFE